MSEAALHNMFNRARIDDRQVNELMGLAQGIVADGVVNQEEAEFLQNWLVANAAAQENPVIMTLYARVAAMLEDGILDAEERAELLDTLTRITGGDFGLGELRKATRLPLCAPPPDVDFRGRHFTFTGTFAFGTRNDCAVAVEVRGAEEGPLRMSTDFLVIGVYATDSWAHGPFGRKIEQAVKWRDAGAPIRIVSEEHWLTFLT